MDAGGHGQRAGVAVITQPRADLFHPRADVCGIRKAVSRQVHLINVERMPIDPRPKRLPATFTFAGSDGHWRAVSQPHIAIDVILPQRLLEPFDAKVAKTNCPRQGRPRVPYAARVDAQRAVAKPFARAA